MALSIFLFLLVLQVSTAVSTKNLTGLFPAVLFFGDSTADPGNNNYIPTAFKANHQPYGQDFPGQVPTGRFSNGKLVPDMFSSLIGIKETVPPFLQPNISDDDIRTGVNFASAGSGYDDLTANISHVIQVSKQTVYFKEYLRRLRKVVGIKEAKRIVKSALVTISAGTNDFTISFYDVAPRRMNFTIDGYQDFVLSKLRKFVNELYKLGCRKMVVTGLPPMGCLPIQMTAKFKDPFSRTCIHEQNRDARVYNNKLAKLLPLIQSSLPGTTILYADIYHPIMDMILNPHKHGFVETSVGCCGTGFVETGPICTPLTPMCTDSSTYLFFDSVHPTEAAYRYIAKRLVNQILPKL